MIARPPASVPPQPPVGPLGPRLPPGGRPSPAAPSPGSAPPAEGPRLAAVAPDAIAHPDEVLVSQPPSEPDGTIETAAQRLGLTILERTNLSLLAVRVVRLRIPDGRAVEQVVQALSLEPGVGPVQPNFIYRRQQGPDQAPFAPEKAAMTGAQAAITGRNVLIAVIDTGVDGTHPDMRRTSLASHDLLGETVPAEPAHATAIAGIIAARGLTRGVAPDARLLSLRAFASFAPTQAGRPSRSTTMVVLKALEEAIARKARILNLSFAGPHDPLLENAIGAVVGRNTVVIAAAGNEGDRAEPAFPGAYLGVIAVTATDARDRLYARANRGAYIAVAAPGVDVLAASADHGHELVSGTSFAAAHVSGLVALVLQQQPGMSPADVRKVLQETSRDLGQPGRDQGFGAGLVDAKAILAHELVIGGQR